MVRAQGGTETAIRLGLRSQEFYAASGDRFPLDCGFVAQGYLMPCFTRSRSASRRTGASRCSSQPRPRRRVARPATTSTPAHTGLAPGATLGASYAPGDGYIDAPRNVLAYTAALTASGVDVRERCAFTGLRTVGRHGSSASTPSDGPIDTERVVLTGGPQLAEVGARGGRHGSRRAAPGTRSSSPPPLPDLDVHELPMVFDVTSGIYWRPGEAGGLLWGMSNPDEPPGTAVDFDNAYYHKARDRIEDAVPGRARASGCGGPGPRPSTTPPTTCRSSVRCSPTTARSTAPWSPARPATA